jgi:hypothetical protein
VCYPWHPWYGRTVHVIHSVTRGGQTFLRCGLQPDDGHRARDFPLWMFDPVRCCTMRLTRTPVVSVEGLRQVRQLLSVAAAAPPVVKLQHPPSQPQGDADAPKTPSEAATAHRPVHTSPDETHLGQPASGGDAKRHATARRVAAQAAPPPATAGATRGGRR